MATVSMSRRTAKNKDHEILKEAMALKQEIADAMNHFKD
jgi:hypothetical protein